MGAAEWKAKGEERSASVRVGGDGRAAVLPGDAGDDGQPEAGARSRPGPGRPARSGRRRGRGRRPAGRGRGPGPRRRPRPGRVRADTSIGGARRRVPDRVRRQVGDGLAEVVAVAERRSPAPGASSVTGRSGATALVSLQASAASTARSTSVRSAGRVRSSWARRSRSSTSVFMRADSWPMRRKTTVEVDPGSPRLIWASSAKPWIDVSGVRSSCEASARNWRSRCSVASRSANDVSRSPEHRVEGEAELADLRALVGRLDPLREVAGRDRAGRGRHVLEGSQAPAQEQPRARRRAARAGRRPPPAR